MSGAIINPIWIYLMGVEVVGETVNNVYEDIITLLDDSKEDSENGD